MRAHEDETMKSFAFEIFFSNMMSYTFLLLYYWSEFRESFMRTAAVLWQVNLRSVSIQMCSSDRTKSKFLLSILPIIFFCGIITQNCLHE